MKPRRQSPAFRDYLARSAERRESMERSGEAVVRNLRRAAEALRERERNGRPPRAA